MHGQWLPKGVQPYLNRLLEARFAAAAWEGRDGRFRKEDTWVRVTFRHQMSLGADFLDAMRLAKKEGVGEVAICAATTTFLTLISPNDAKTLVSYEKLISLAAELHGVLTHSGLVASRPYLRYRSKWHALCKRQGRARA